VEEEQRAPIALGGVRESGVDRMTRVARMGVWYCFYRVMALNYGPSARQGRGGLG
jgi:hypothetical protein